MHSHDKILQVYLDLAEMYLQQQDDGMREVFLMLAADAALKGGKASQAELLRQELLRQNPYHALKPFPTFVEAAQHPDIESYLDDLRMKYPIEVAEDMLESVGLGNLPPPTDGVPRTEPPRPRSQKAPAPEQPQPLVPDATDPEKPIKVYRETYEVDETQPPPPLPPTLPPRPQRPLAQPRPTAPRPAAARPVPPARSAAPPPARPRQSPPRVAQPPAVAASAPPTTKPEPENDDATNGAWVGTLLYLLVLAAAVALAMFTLVPHELLQD